MLFQRFFGSSNDRKVKAMMARVAKINALEPQIQGLSDEALRGKTAEFKARLAKGETLDQLLEEAFAELAARAAKDEALLRTFEASGQSPEAFADMYGLDVRAVARAVQSARARLEAVQAAANAPDDQPAASAAPDGSDAAGG